MEPKNLQRLCCALANSNSCCNTFFSKSSLSSRGGVSQRIPGENLTEHSTKTEWFHKMQTSLNTTWTLYLEERTEDKALILCSVYTTMASAQGAVGSFLASWWQGECLSQELSQKQPYEAYGLWHIMLFWASRKEAHKQMLRNYPNTTKGNYLQVQGEVWCLSLCGAMIWNPDNHPRYCKWKHGVDSQRWRARAGFRKLFCRVAPFSYMELFQTEQHRRKNVVRTDTTHSKNISKRDCPTITPWELPRVAFGHLTCLYFSQGNGRHSF